MARAEAKPLATQDESGGLRGKTARSLWGDAFRQLTRNKAAVAGLIVFALIVVMAVLAPVLAPHDPIKLNTPDSLVSPNSRYWMGTDSFGRDELSRIIYGARISVQMGFVAVLIAVIGGSLLGLVSGYYRGLVDMVVARLTDVMLAFPGILLALVIIAILGRNLRSAMIAVGVSGMPIFIRVVRSSVLSVREREYIAAARVIGCHDARILSRHILPNVLAPVIVLATLGIPNAIIAGASLSFLGLGVSPPTADWGGMLSDGRSYVTSAWWLSTFPGLAIVVMVLAINLFGDGLRDALDPRQKG